MKTKINTNNVEFKNRELGARETAQWVRPYLHKPDKQGVIPET